MKKKLFISAIFVLVLLTGSFLISNEKNLDNDINNIEVTILEKGNGIMTIKDKNNLVYKINFEDENLQVGSTITLEYKGTLDGDNEFQNVEIVSYEEKDILETKSLLTDNGIFSDYYSLAQDKLSKMTLDEKISQILLVRYPDDETAASIQKKYQFGGYIFFKKDFADKSKDEVKNMIKNVQNVSNIPLLTAVDEEGGVVVRVSSNPNLASSAFKSPSELYNEGGLELIKEDTLNKSNLLASLGLNLNLAPVVDVSTDPADYMYSRSIQQNTEITSEYAKTVIDASKSNSVSYVLKHFPGYGNNNDTHTGEVLDNRTYESIIQNDLPPFESGIKAGAEAVLVSHNIVVNIDQDNPASLSPKINSLLREELNFTGVIITDDLDMGAISNLEDATIKAIQAGNDLIITTNYQTSIDAIKKAINDGTLTENQIERAAQRVLAWKYYKGLIDESQK